MNSYKSKKLSRKRIAIANIDKLSFHKRGSRRTYTPFGTITLYDHIPGVKRFFSVSNSKFIHNGGSYTKTGLRNRILGLKCS